MEIVFLLVGLAFVAIGVAIVFSELRSRQGAVQVRGELIGFSTGASASGGPSYCAVARYAGFDGQTRYVESSVGSSVPLGSVGDALSIYVHPDDPERAAIRSSLSYILGGVLAAMGAVPCVIFFKTFRPTPFSLASAGAVIAWGAWKLFRGVPDKASAVRALRDSKGKVFSSRIFTEATKAQIRWADVSALEASVQKARNANRFAAPFLVVTGLGLIALGMYLHNRTEAFLARALHGRGVVVAMAANRSNNSTTWAPVVEFEDGSRSFRFKDSVSSSPPSWQVGDIADVLYDPANPSDARIDRGFWNRGVPFLVTAGGALFLCLGVIVAARRKKPQALATLQGA